MDEEWVQIDEFPNYSVSNYGRARNDHTDRIMRLHPNQAGILMVTFQHEGKQHLRSMKSLVADKFLARYYKRWVQGELGDWPVPERYTTPIQIDTNLENCRVDNLAWRPRWFAIEYTRQFKEPNPRHFFGPIVEIHTGEEHATMIDAARAYGLIVSSTVGIMQCHFYGTGVLPTGQIFQSITK